jgi:uncharacterized phage-associated protein
VVFNRRPDREGSPDNVNSRVEFPIDIDKVIATVIFLASRNIPDLTPGKLYKLMFLAEKYHLVRFGRTITGDRYHAMEEGPVPSFTYALIKKQILKTQFTDPARILATKLEIDKTGRWPEIRSHAEFDKDQLSVSDMLALEYVIQHFGNLPFEVLSDLTHKMDAYNRAWKSRGFKDAVPMKFEDFFEGDEDAIPAVKEEMIENHILDTVFAKRR